MRMAGHRTASKKKNNSTSEQLFEGGNPVIVLVENFPCNSKEELHKRERFYIENNSCVNKIIPGRTNKEWREANAEKIKKHKKEYNQENKEKILEYTRRYRIDHAEQLKQYKIDNASKINKRNAKKITCECGAIVSYSSLTKHKKNKKHFSLLEQ